MKSIVCEKPNVFKETESDFPQLKSGEAIVSIKRIGVCGTDLHAFKGNQPFFQYPRVLGHELAGIVEKVEENEFGLKKGDQVAVIPYMECGKCAACCSGKTNCCTQLKVLGVHMDGGMSQQISVPYDHLIKTEELSLDQTAVLEPLSIGAHAIRRSEVQKGESVLVIGAGPIGLGVMAFAKQQGANVIAMDINDERLDFCKKQMNVDYTINALNSPIDFLEDITQGDMPSIVFDATGNQKSMMNSFAYPANGGKLIFVGLVKSDLTFYDPDFHSKELTLMSSRNATKEDFDYVVESIKNRAINTDSYITHRVHYDQVISKFNMFMDPKANVIKAMIEM